MFQKIVTESIHNVQNKKSDNPSNKFGMIYGGLKGLKYAKTGAKIGAVTGGLIGTGLASLSDEDEATSKTGAAVIGSTIGAGVGAVGSVVGGALFGRYMQKLYRKEMHNEPSRFSK